MSARHRAPDHGAEEMTAERRDRKQLLHIYGGNVDGAHAYLHEISHPHPCASIHRALERRDGGERP